jgi:hypothetical protein
VGGSDDRGVGGLCVRIYVRVCTMWVYIIPPPPHTHTHTQSTTFTHPLPPPPPPPHLLGVRAPPPATIVYAEDERDTVSNCIRKALAPGQVELVVCCIEKEVRGVWVWGVCGCGCVGGGGGDTGLGPSVVMAFKLNPYHTFSFHPFPDTD